MRTKFKLILLLAFLMCCGLVNSSEYDWNQVRDQNGIKVYIKKYWDDDIRSFKGISIINSSIDSILALIMDLDACGDWIHRCKKSTLLLRKSFTECYHHQIQSFPFLVQDRDFILHSKIIRSHKNNSIIIQINAVTGFCAQNRHLCAPIGDTSALIRIKHAHGYYLLEPVKHNLTRVSWVQHTNPEGDLPSWIVNQMIQEMPYQTLLGLQKKVFEKKYQNLSLMLSPEGNIIGFKTYNKKARQKH